MPSLFKKTPTYAPPPHEWLSKTAGSEVKLGPDPNGWPEQILQEAFKTIPSLKDYQPNVVMQQTDPETNTAYGALVVTTQGDPATPSPYEVSVHIPILIQEGKLMPLDLLVRRSEHSGSSVTQPLTERRLRRALFRPDTFDIVAPPASDISLLGAQFPPGRGGYNGAGSLMGMGKIASSGSILDDVLPHADPNDVKVLQREVVAHKVAFEANPRAVESLRKLASTRPQGGDVRERALHKVASQAPSTVVQYTSNGDGSYTVKSASALAWAPTEAIMSRRDLLKVASPEEVDALDQSGEVTVGLGGEEGDVPEMPALRPVTKPGLYKVRTTEGKDLTGMVFTDLIDLDGMKAPSLVFTNGSQTTHQANIGGTQLSAIPAGMLVGSGGVRPSTGLGMWVGTNPEGEVEATVPMQLRGGVAGLLGGGFIMESPEGVRGSVEISPSLRSIEAIDGKLIIPASYAWLSLSGESAGALEGPTPAPLGGGREVTASDRQVILGAHGDVFSLSGPAVEKIAQAERSALTPGEAIFMLSGLGVSPPVAATKLAQALHTRGAVKIATKWNAETPEGLVQGYLGEIKKAGAKIAGLGRVSLVKEAAFVSSAQSIDGLLSLGLLSPETVAVFVQKIPQFEETLQDLSQLLLASRLGLQEVPAAALEKAVQSLDRVLEGLMALRFQEPGSPN